MARHEANGCAAMLLLALYTMVILGVGVLLGWWLA